MENEISMPVRFADATWSGGLKDGEGIVELESGVYNGPYDYMSRFEKGALTNPEELLGAAHATCYAMFLSALLETNKTPATKVEAKSSVTIKSLKDEGPTITKIELTLVGEVSNISEEKFLELAQEAKMKCPISKSLASVKEITLNATLKT